MVGQAEAGPSFVHPLHPCAEALPHSIPRLDGPPEASLRVIPGTVRDLAHPRRGCRFAARGADVLDACREAGPPLVAAGRGPPLLRVSG